MPKLAEQQTTSTADRLSIPLLLLGLAFLLFAGGINGLLLPLRGSIEGFSALSLGLLGTGWAVGYMLGCLWVPQLVRSVGHIRSFSAMSTLAGLSVLASLLLLQAVPWIILRGLAGFCFAGAAMIVESWLGERSSAENRGRVFAIYTMVNLGATTAGQMIISVGSPAGYALFVLAAMSYGLAVIPTTVTTITAPQPLRQVQLDLRRLWRNSPIAVVAVFAVGLSNGAFGTLGAVYATAIGLSVTAIAAFMSMAILGGALIQLPVGYLSDRIDRRLALILLGGFAFACDAAFLLLAPQDTLTVMLLASLLGAGIYSMYPVILAHANDRADGVEMIAISGGLLLLYGAGSMVGPLMAGAAMSLVSPTALFAVTLGAHAAVVIYSALRIRSKAAPAEADKVLFQPAGPAKTATPEALALTQVSAAVAEAAEDEDV